MRFYCNYENVIIKFHCCFIPAVIPASLSGIISASQGQDCTQRKPQSLLSYIHLLLLTHHTRTLMTAWGILHCAHQMNECFYQWCRSTKINGQNINGANQNFILIKFIKRSSAYITQKLPWPDSSSPSSTKIWIMLAHNFPLWRNWQTTHQSALFYSIYLPIYLLLLYLSFYFLLFTTAVYAMHYAKKLPSLALIASSQQ